MIWIDLVALGSTFVLLLCSSSRRAAHKTRATSSLQAKRLTISRYLLAPISLDLEAHLAPGRPAGKGQRPTLRPAPTLQSPADG